MRRRLLPPSTTSPSSSASPSFGADADAVLRSQLDMRLMPVLWILLVLNYLGEFDRRGCDSTRRALTPSSADRNALASARVQGIEEDLGMKGSDFNVAISVRPARRCSCPSTQTVLTPFHVPDPLRWVYDADAPLESDNADALLVADIVGGVPANMMLSRSRPSYFVAFFVALWGAVSLSTAFVQTRNQLYAVRVLLGVVEAPCEFPPLCRRGFRAKRLADALEPADFPGSVFLLSSWYSRSELALRTAIVRRSRCSWVVLGEPLTRFRAPLAALHGLPPRRRLLWLH